MKMKKYLSIDILLMMMASPVVFTSCGNDDPMEEVESPETKLDVWTEPYHIMGANVDEVKSYMAQSMKRYRQVAETSGDNIQLTFMTGQGSEGVLYSFSRLDGSLYSVIDTERSVNRGLVIDYLKKHYTLVSADDACLHHCKKTQLLSPTAYSNTNRQPELEEPIGRIYTYLYNNFREKVVLKDVADFVGQNPTSLCRYFKKSTDKSIFQVLAEIRIEYACKLLANSDLTITEVAFSSGYNTPTLFFEQFQKIIHLTPAEYRREINGTAK